MSNRQFTCPICQSETYHNSKTDDNDCGCGRSWYPMGDGNWGSRARPVIMKKPPYIGDNYTDVIELKKE